ncbi:MAG: nickel transporter [Burkholderiales bacterium]|nr:nickel transporter [Burkholderiales bacterium]
MFIVPVIDLMEGQVVHARRGDRAGYAPIRSPLTASSDPLSVVQALRSVADFHHLYVADLDGIRGTGDHRPVTRAIVERFPMLTIWFDAGIGSVERLADWPGPTVVPVVGSESLASAVDLVALRDAAPELLLSLDSRDGVPLGPPDLFDHPDLWPAIVIGMTLDRVGSGEGPAWDRLVALIAESRDRRVVAAGGVRNVHDLERLDALGVHAVLVASAIHDGGLDRGTLTRYAA